MPLPLFKYTVPGLLIRNDDVGCLDKPHLFAISSGKFNQKSLIFHFKIGNKYYDCEIHRINKSFCNMWCVEKSCKARHKLKVDPRFIKCYEKFYQMENGSS